MRALADWPVDTPLALAQWHLEATAIQISILSSKLWDEVPHFVTHYLADVDLRSKDPEYLALQRHELEQALVEWQQRAV